MPHSHGHHHHAPPAERDFGLAFAAGTALNLVFVLVEGGFGLVSGSMALLADAGHNLSDVVTLVFAWAASAMSRRQPTARYTYGLRRSSILAALFNAALLLVAVGAIGVESVRRLVEPAPVASVTVIVVAAIGIVINGATALFFLRGSAGDLNVRSAFLHMVADTLVSVGVVGAGIAMMATGWLWLDPAVGIAIVAAIAASMWDLLRQSLRLALDAVPNSIDPDAVRAYIASLPGVAGLHDLHIWPMSTTETALTCHLVMPAGHPGDAALAEIADQLAHRFGIGHATLQVETGDPAHACILAPDHVV
ncbi:MAG TPA: cation diffusion facilitator family transporter [Stellaceae bacterium]|nr:cation diffusion facilitator family transporter [Stellaceae bacterium]